MENNPLDTERQKKARHLARIERRLMVLELALGGIYVLLWLLMGWSTALREALNEFTQSPWLTVLAFGVIFGGIYVLITIPILVYEGYVLPHRFGLSIQSFSEWVIDQIKGGIMAGVLGIVILQIVYALLRAAPETWWIWTGLVLTLFSVLLANLAPVLIFPVFYKFRPLGDEHEELVDRLMRLADRAQARVQGVYQFDMSRRSTTANAALAGLGSTRCIILGDTLLEDYDSDEIETILAHELAHHVHHDIPVGIAVQSAITFVGLYLAALFLDWGVSALGFAGVADVAAMPLIVLAIGMYGLITMPLENAFSRWRERRADEYALAVTGKGQAFASALARLADQNLSDADPDRWVALLFNSHPPLSERIARAKSYPLTRSE